MRVLQIGADRSKRGILQPGSPGYARQKAYAEHFDALDIIGYSLRRDRFTRQIDGALHTVPTNSFIKLFYGIDALIIAARLPKPDIVSAQDPHQSGLLALWIARWFGVPLHVQLHSDILSDEFAMHSLINRFRRIIARFVLARADGVRVVSARIKASVEKYVSPDVPITVLPIYVDRERLHEISLDAERAQRFSPFSTWLLFVGRLESEKHPALALSAFAKSAPKEACLIVVGDGSARQELEGYVREHHLDDRVFFEGERDAVAYYSLADLVLVPSAYEGYGLVIVEALAAGKPVLATDVGIAREAGAIVTDEAHFAEALAAWFQNGPRTGELRDYPYQSFEDYVRQYCDDIQSVV